jgi:hypothetical protein
VGTRDPGPGEGRRADGGEHERRAALREGSGGGAEGAVSVRIRPVVRQNRAGRHKVDPTLISGQSQLNDHPPAQPVSSFPLTNTKDFVRWQRRRFRKHWAKLSRKCRVGPHLLIPRSAPSSAKSRPPILWGAPRIHGELLKLGIQVAERTVSRLLPKRPAPPSQTWRTFLTNHVRDLVSIDFFTVPTVGLRLASLAGQLDDWICRLDIEDVNDPSPPPGED